MAGRPIDHRRRDDLLDAVVGFAVQHGFAELTWRPLALALDVTPTTLVHRFGSKERMLEEVQQRLRERILHETALPAGADSDLAAQVEYVWRRVSDPARAGEFRLFFAVYGRALQAPDSFADFLGHVIADSTSALRGGQERTGVDARAAEVTATLVIATLRGLLLDLLTTGDRARVDLAAERFIASL